VSTPTTVVGDQSEPGMAVKEASKDQPKMVTVVSYVQPKTCQIRKGAVSFGT